MSVHHQSVLKPPRVGTRFPSEICVSILASITRARSQFAFDDEVWVWFTTRIMLSCQSVVNRVQRKCKCNNRWLTCRSSKTKQSAIDTLMGSVSLVSRRHPITSYVHIDDISIPHLQEKKHHFVLTWESWINLCLEVYQYLRLDRIPIPLNLKYWWPI